MRSSIFVSTGLGECVQAYRWIYISRGLFRVLSGLQEKEEEGLVITHAPGKWMLRDRFLKASKICAVESDP